MKKIIIGDVHGCDKALRALLERLRQGEEDRLILLGDLFDRERGIGLSEGQARRAGNLRLSAAY